ncbi:ABC transporter ATP-binding protein [Mesorhizobium sp. 1B3]|uniref:ABC transporter ATP-binding protein n=1 Tax=Mesorhizobium sp. 1B3 TaxID=3243599 RepID=UPI003D98978F
MASLLQLDDLSVGVQVNGQSIKLIDHVCFSVAPGQILGLVGESGCGKSTVVKSILNILGRGLRFEGGAIQLEGKDLTTMSEAELSRDVRGGRIGFVPQDPMLALNPTFRVGTQLLEIWKRHGPAHLRRDTKTGRQSIIDLFRDVQLPEPEEAYRKYPHEFSGGQRQRILIAAALLCGPKLIIADEATTALDVTIQHQILGLLKKLAKERKVGILLVTHDLGVVNAICDSAVVMYAGQVVESGNVDSLLGSPAHPYTQALFERHPDREAQLSGIPGLVAQPGSFPTGCRFRPRCSKAQDGCATRSQHFQPIAADHSVNCILYDVDEEHSHAFAG